MIRGVKDKLKENKKKRNLCESIGHQPLMDRCPKMDPNQRDAALPLGFNNRKKDVANKSESVFGVFGADVYLSAFY